MSDSRLSPLMASLVLAGVAIAWGAVPLFVRSDVSAAGLVGVRVTFGAIALIIGAAAAGRLRFPPVHRGRLVVSGLLLATHWITFFASVKVTTVAIALSVVYIGPIVASILAGPLLGQVVPRRIWISLAVAATGTVLVVQPWSMSGDNGASVKGLLLAGIAGALFTALMIVGYPAVRDLRGLTMSIGELTVASVALAPATYGALTTHPDQLVNFLVLGAVFTGLTGFLYWETYRLIPIATVSTISYLDPASAVIWAMVFLNEMPEVLTWFGVGLVIVGGAMAAAVPNKGIPQRVPVAQ